MVPPVPVVPDVARGRGRRGAGAAGRRSDYRFTLDGQLATVDDYLEIRPENEERLRQFVQAGRLAIGPWQTLIDEFLVGGETIVRNLERGLARAADFGDAMRIGYLPDIFGHVAQMPQILPPARDRGRRRLAGRARGSRPHCSVGGARRLGGPGRVPAEGYSNAAHAFDGPEDTLDALEQALLPWYGAMPCSAWSGPTTCRRCGARRAAPRRDARRLPRRGGLRRGLARLARRAPLRARANLLPGCISARIDLKAPRRKPSAGSSATPSRCRRSTATGARAVPARGVDARLQNAAHDSICGCSADEVSAQVLVRYAEAEQIGRELGVRALDRIAGPVPRGTSPS